MEDIAEKRRIACDGAYGKYDTSLLHKGPAEWLNKYKFPTEHIYVIHVCIKFTSIGSSEDPWEMQCVDNYGNIHITSNSGLYENKLGIDAYKYPLTKTYIDLIKSLPQSVMGVSQRTAGIQPMGICYTCLPGGSITESLRSVAIIRAFNTDIHELAETTTALRKKTAETETLRAENDKLNKEILLLNTVVEIALGLDRKIKAE